MNLKPELLAVLSELGVTAPELEPLKERMMSAVTSLQAYMTALDAQIDTLTAQRDAAAESLVQANVTVNKLLGN